MEHVPFLRLPKKSCKKLNSQKDLQNSTETLKTDLNSSETSPTVSSGINVTLTSELMATDFPNEDVASYVEGKSGSKENAFKQMEEIESKKGESFLKNTKKISFVRKKRSEAKNVSTYEETSPKWKINSKLIHSTFKVKKSEWKNMKKDTFIKMDQNRNHFNLVENSKIVKNDISLHFKMPKTLKIINKSKTPNSFAIFYFTQLANISNLQEEKEKIILTGNKKLKLRGESYTRSKRNSLKKEKVRPLLDQMEIPQKEKSKLYFVNAKNIQESQKSSGFMNKFLDSKNESTELIKIQNNSYFIDASSTHPPQSSFQLQQNSPENLTHLSKTRTRQNDKHNLDQPINSTSLTKKNHKLEQNSSNTLQHLEEKNKQNNFHNFESLDISESISSSGVYKSDTNKPQMCFCERQTVVKCQNLHSIPATISREVTKL